MKQWNKTNAPYIFISAVMNRDEQFRMGKYLFFSTNEWHSFFCSKINDHWANSFYCHLTINVNSIQNLFINFSHKIIHEKKDAFSNYHSTQLYFTNQMQYIILLINYIFFHLKLKICIWKYPQMILLK